MSEPDLASLPSHGLLRTPWSPAPDLAAIALHDWRGPLLAAPARQSASQAGPPPVEGRSRDRILLFGSVTCSASDRLRWRAVRGDPLAALVITISAPRLPGAWSCGLLIGDADNGELPAADDDDAIETRYFTTNLPDIAPLPAIDAPLELVCIAHLDRWTSPAVAILVTP